MKKLLQDRKTLYLVLGIVIISVFTLSIAYASLSTILEIHGNSEVVASTWNIHLDNVEVKSGSVSSNAPQISGTSSLSFDVDLNLPGDYYEFTVDVVNEGSIDAMIDSVIKTPELTNKQAKYIKYEITYENGESISTKQTLKKGTATPIKVRLEYRNDLSASDLPSSSTELSLKLTLVYVQSDGSGSNISNNGVSVVNVVSGDGTNVGDEICISDECFYVISSTNDTVTMLSKYNLYVGYYINYFDEENSDFFIIEYDAVKQNPLALGVLIDRSGDVAEFPIVGGVGFSSSEYWSGKGYSYPKYVFNENSDLYSYIMEYKTYLNNYISLIDIRLITYEELKELGCSTRATCNGGVDWVYLTSYWTGTAQSDGSIYSVERTGVLSSDFSYDASFLGIRPVIEISRALLK